MLTIVTYIFNWILLEHFCNFPWGKQPHVRYSQPRIGGQREVRFIDANQGSRHCLKCFICVNSFNPYNNPIRQVCLFVPFHRKETGPEALSYLSRAAESDDEARWSDYIQPKALNHKPPFPIIDAQQSRVKT